tara:strand:+ start:10115 stop:10345 length:231 start_codon:yes stop_codon:yes gene_type:complete
LAVYSDGKFYHNYYGELDKNSNNPPNDKTLYEIASVSKVFAGSLAAKADLENKLTLDDDIRKYLVDEYITKINQLK